MEKTSYLGIKAFKAAPTKKHVPAIWECMLGTVYAMNTAGEARYFDYDYDAAKQWAGVDQPGVDLRLARVKDRKSYVRSGCVDSNPGTGRLVLWASR